MGMTFIEQVDERIATALASGALEPIRAEESVLDEAGMRFAVRWVSSLAVKDATKVDAAKLTMPGGPRDPNFNPFKAPDPALTVGPVGDMHTAILNKFPVCERHLVLARREFEEQLTPLALCDFAALASILCEAGGLGFYNGGTAAGASQRHKHVQWIPAAVGNANLRLYAAGLPGDAREHQAVTHAALKMRHCFMRTAVRAGAEDAAARSMHEAFGLALAFLDLRTDAEGLLPPFNLLVGDDWMLVVPRRAECFEGISIAAINYGGTHYVRRPEQIDTIRQVGPLAVLAEVGYELG